MCYFFPNDATVLIYGHLFILKSSQVIRKVVKSVHIFWFIMIYSAYRQGSRCRRGWGGLAPPTFHFMSGKILKYGPKTVRQILTDSFLPAIFFQRVCFWLSAKLQPLPLLKNIESPAHRGGDDRGVPPPPPPWFQFFL